MDQKIMRGEGADRAEGPEDFLANLGRVLRAQEGVDVELAEILATHLLTARPDADAVSKAKDAILKLASNRAVAPNSEPDNG